MSSKMEESKQKIGFSWSKFTFKVNGLEKPVEVIEINEGMARYSVMNVYHTSNMELIGEKYI